MRSLLQKVLSNRKPIMLAARVLIAIVVIAFLGFAFRSAWNQLSESQIDWSEVRPAWFFLGGIFYFVGMSLAGMFWHLVLRDAGQDPAWHESLRAFFVSQLGKYVPGKALVVVLRINEIRKQGTDGTIAAVSVFVETLSWMSVGATMAVAILAFRFQNQPWLIGLGIAIAVIAGLPTVGPVLRRIIRVLKVKKLSPEIETKLKLSPGLMIKGWTLLALGWLAMGGSLYSILQALPSPRPEWVDFPLVTACVALAVVCGFVSLLPGGMGVRELVMLPLLGPLVGPVTAVIAVVVLRLVWLLVELITAAIFKLLHYYSFKQKPVLS